MNFCKDHWDRLRAKIDERGLSHLVAPDGQTAAMQFADQLRRGDEEDSQTPVNFDPLMAAWAAIGMNVGDVVERAGGSPLYVILASDSPEDPIEFANFRPDLATAARARLEREGKTLTWPRCGLCYVGLIHELTCTEGCDLAIVDGFAWMLDRAADDALEKARDLGLVERAA